ncbi:MAG: hypothetical protein IJF48_04360 [Clostridia bacterium]|nr:hypothetical protein [Clostridia bacterium]
MPYINAKVSVNLTEEKAIEFKAALGKAIEAIPGKTETYLMVCIEDGQKLWFAGDNTKPQAFIDVRILGRAKSEDYSRMTGVLCDICNDLLGISPDSVYVTYSEFENWGWNGKNF